MKKIQLYRQFINEANITNNNFNLSDNELYQIAKWGLTKTYTESGCWDDNENDLESAIECVIGDFKIYLSTDYPIELGNIPNEPVIYRIVRLKNINDLDKNKLGNSWFSNPKQYERSEFYDMLDYLKAYKTSEGETYLLKGKVSIDNIDVRKTLWERTTQYWENEIVIIDDSNIELLDITKMSDLI